MTVIKRLARALVPRTVRGWLRNPVQTARWVIDDAVAACGLTTEVQLRPDWKFRSHPAAYRSAYHVQQTDPEQTQEFDQFVSTCRPGMVLFDLGAHFGLFSLAALHYGGPAARAVAVDPSTLAEKMIHYQRRVNRLTERLRVLRAAASDTVGVLGMVSAGIGSAGYFVRAEADHSAAEQTTVQTVTIDSLSESSGWKPTHLKVDVEGFELSALRGGESTFRSADPPVVFLELHCDIIRGAGGDPRDCLDLLGSWGYRFRSVHGEPVNSVDLLSQNLVRFMASTSD